MSILKKLQKFFRFVGPEPKLTPEMTAALQEIFNHRKCMAFSSLNPVELALKARAKKLAE